MGLLMLMLCTYTYIHWHARKGVPYNVEFVSSLNEINKDTDIKQTKKNE